MTGGLVFCSAPFKAALLLRRIGNPINGILQLWDPSKTFKNCLISLQLGPVGRAGASGDMVGRFWSKLDSWGCPGARVMTICVFYVGPHFLNIGYVDVYEGI